MASWEFTGFIHSFLLLCQGGRAVLAWGLILDSKGRVDFNSSFPLAKWGVSFRLRSPSLDWWLSCLLISVLLFFYFLTWG